jgi:iron complex outermembrane receptor protein
MPTPPVRRRRRAWHAASLVACPAIAWAQAAEPPLVIAHHTLERVDITGARPSTLPIEIPTSTESIDGATIERTINATDSEDALKYFPSLLVRKRYIGDYDHAVLATRASGTGNSARSLVYADGILLSNLLGNGATFTPRWGLVTPEEIERVDVLYGPFSAAYAGNSAGAIVDYLTRMPKRFEAHVKLSANTQHYTLYGTDDRFSGAQGSASLGNRAGDWSWWVNLSRLDSDAQPITFANKLVSAGTPGTAGVPVTGAVLGNDPRNRPWVLFGATSQTHTVQDHAKLKLAYDVSPTLRATYTLGLWRNEADRDIQSFMVDAAGQPVTLGVVNVDGRSYTLTPLDFAQTRADLEHMAQGLSLKQRTGGTWDWDVAVSSYDYHRDTTRSSALTVPVVPAPTPFPAITDLSGTGWTTLALRSIWRPAGVEGAHIVEAGLQRDAFKLRNAVYDTPQWQDGAPGQLRYRSTGDTVLQSLWLQDAWRFAPRWRTVLGARLEDWRASNGTASAPGFSQALAERHERDVSPKAAVSYQPADDWSLNASVGRAVRMPTVSELYQGSVSAAGIVANDPNLRPEKSWTAELSAERVAGGSTLRATAFFERTEDALYSQTNVTVSPSVTNIQNVDLIRTMGVELAWRADDVWIKGLELGASATYADSKILKNDKFPASVGKRQPRVPLWRANLVATWNVDERWSATFGARYSGRQFGQLDNSDTNDFAYTGFSRFFVTDLRVQWRFAKQWAASFGIDNINATEYWAFHPYPQRTYSAELRFDL